MPAMRHLFVLLTCLLIAGCSSFTTNQAPANKQILDIAYSYPNGGKYNWKGSGTPHPIIFKNETILGAGEGGTYCSGFTFTVVMRAATDRKLLTDKTPADIRKFQKEWYGATGDTEVQAGPAMENLGIGRRIPLEQARPGDFVQFWRGKSGHSAIFLNWVVEDGKKIGFKYRSTQKSTDGIGDKIEYFNDAPGKDGQVIRSRTYFARLN